MHMCTPGVHLQRMKAIFGLLLGSEHHAVRKRTMDLPRICAIFTICQCGALHYCRVNTTCIFFHLAQSILGIVPYFLKYSRSKIFAVERNLCISEIIRASKFRG